VSQHEGHHYQKSFEFTPFVFFGIVHKQFEDVVQIIADEVDDQRTPVACDLKKNKKR
jgi:hypothetical protein